MARSSIMRSARIIKLFCCTGAVLAVVAVFAVWMNYRIHRIPIPKREKLTDCTSETLSFQMAIRYHEPYAIILGLPHTSAGQLSFRGEMQLRQSTQIVARIPISSDDMTSCNWLDQKGGASLAGYILTWGRDNRDDRLRDILVRGRTYDVLVTFSQSPPSDSSLWLASIGRVGEP